MNIAIPVEFIARMLKGNGKIEPRTPFRPYVISAFGKESPGKTAGLHGRG